MSKFTREQAIVICQRKLPTHHSIDDLPTNCRDCYYYDSRCEVTGERDPEELCYLFRFDNRTTNMVRWNILHNRKWVLEHWKSLCHVDRELYMAIYECIVYVSR